MNTLEMAIDILSWVCLISGSLFAVVGGIGIIRLPDFFTRLHGGGITDTMGAGLVMVGLMLQSVKVGLSRLDADPWLITIKLVMILVVLLITSSTACHALAQSALQHDVRPHLSDAEDGPSE